MIYNATGLLRKLGTPVCAGVLVAGRTHRNKVARYVWPVSIAMMGVPSWGVEAIRAAAPMSAHGHFAFAAATGTLVDFSSYSL